MVYGRSPFAAHTNWMKKIRAITDPNVPIPFPRIADSLLLDVLKGCLQRDPKKRPTIPG